MSHAHEAEGSPDAYTAGDRTSAGSPGFVPESSVARRGPAWSDSELLALAVGGVRATADNCTGADETCEVYSKRMRIAFLQAAPDGENLNAQGRWEARSALSVYRTFMALKKQCSQVYSCEVYFRGLNLTGEVNYGDYERLALAQQQKTLPDGNIAAVYDLIRDSEGRSLQKTKNRGVFTLDCYRMLKRAQLLQAGSTSRGGVSGVDPTQHRSAAQTIRNFETESGDRNDDTANDVRERPLGVQAAKRQRKTRQRREASQTSDDIQSILSEAVNSLKESAAIKRQKYAEPGFKVRQLTPEEAWRDDLFLIKESYDLAEKMFQPGSNDYNEAIGIARERYLSGARSMRGKPSLAEQATSSGSHILIETHREQDPKETSI
jgi:hypothetical protein